MSTNTAIQILDNSDTFAPCPADYKPPQKPTPNPTGCECTHCRCAQLEKDLNQLSPYLAKGKELSRDRRDAKRLAERYPGQTIESIRDEAKQEWIEINRQWVAKKRELDLL